MADSVETASGDYRLPSEGDFVSLTEAVTFIAFSTAMSCHELIKALENGQLCDGDLEQAQTRVVDATVALCEAGRNGRIPICGRRVNRGPDEKPETQALTDSNLRDFRQVMFGSDNLYYGTGLVYRLITLNHSELQRKADILHDHYADVEVDRAALLSVFHNGQRVPNDTQRSLPNLSDAKLNAWWSKLSPSDQAKPQDELHKMCVAAHPANSIARRRVRGITPNRNPGPRPIKPDSTA